MLKFLQNTVSDIRKVNMNKLILFDVDSTLIDHDTPRSTIPKQTLKAVRLLREKGYHVGIATGRSYEHIKHIMKVLKMDTAVCFGGHMVVYQNEIIHKQPLDRDETAKLLKRFRWSFYPVVCFDDDHIYVKDFFGRIKKELYKKENTLVGEPHISKLTPMIKLNIKSPIDFYGMMIFKPKMKGLDDFEKLDFNPWGHIGFEVYNKGVSKYWGIQYLADYLDVSMDDVYVFGDNYNDIHMLTHVKHSVAVGNGVQEAKDAASYVAPPISEGGILTACIDLGLLEESHE